MATAQIFALLFFFFHFPNQLHGLQFNFANFSGTPNLNRSGDAVFNDNKLSLTKNTIGVGLNDSVGRAIYPEKFHLWDLHTNTAADFETNFTFTISMLNPPNGADGMAFFIAANNSDPLHPRTLGGCLGLILNCSNHNVSGLVFVEFDTFANPQINDPSQPHIGININSSISVATQTWDQRMKNGSEGHARVRYDSKTANLSVFLTYPSLNGSRSLSYRVNLSEILPEWVVVGFSAATGTLIETHYVLSWGFNSTELRIPEAESDHGGGGQNIGAVIGGAVGGSVVVLGIVIAILIYLRRKREVREAENNDCDDSIDYEFEHESGPRRFSYADLVQATNNFAEQGKLGEGGFGGVYKGFLPVLNQSVAVKRVSKTSKQGRKEYMAEVKIISKLRHKNLVQLVGWCHEKGEFLLIYEFMPNGSLDSHIFGGQNVLSWAQRYKIATGLLDVADKKLCMEFDMKQMECLLMVGLWCAYPDYTFRPSIRQALQVLNFEAPLPNLPKKMPIPKYDAPSSSSYSSTEPFLVSDNSLATGR
ncbi:hypothetical protein COLO4_32427 [Corchorus olitorius]|uniref:Protein kinase domain-containing protein n=1 Tax=Corchorus olitorius TaxID=93759 RepID=A0A1R3GZP5_9ROSI|nr:hypothetical protein COLO4_32427 [Corchorus olitorius]